MLSYGDKVRIASQAVIGFGATVTAGIELYIGLYGLEGSRLLLLGGFLLLGLSPYIALYWAATKMVSGPGTAVFVLIASLVLVLPAVATYVDAISKSKQKTHATL